MVMRLMEERGGGVEEKIPARNGGLRSRETIENSKKSERFDNMVGAPDNRISVLNRTSSDAPGQYIDPSRHLNSVITAHPALYFITKRAGMPG